VNAQKSSLGLNQWLIVLLSLATALIHLVLLNIMMGKLDVLFTLNGIGFLALLAAYFLALPFAKDHHGLVRWAFIGFTAVTILAWIFIGARTPLGYLTTLVEVALVVCLWLDGRK
jgi:hypothetical protein